MTVAKRSISFTPELLKLAQAEADQDHGGNLSALVAAALDAHLKNRRLGRLIDRWEAKHGAFTEEEMAAVDKELWG